MDKKILDTIFNNEETSPRTMLKEFRNLKYQLQSCAKSNPFDCTLRVNCPACPYDYKHPRSSPQC